MSWKRIAAMVASAPMVLWLSACVLLYFAQDLLLYPRPAPRPIEGARRVDQVQSEQTDVEVPVAWYGDAPTGVVWFHGNGEQLADSVYMAPPFVQRGIGFSAIEHAGYGLSAGQGPDEASILAGARAGMERIGGKPACVGWSLGSGVAARMASEGRCSSLVLLSPYKAIVDVAADQYWMFPVRALIHDGYETRSFAADLEVPTLIVHGRSDRLIPVEHGRALAQMIPDAEYIEVEGGHLIGGDAEVLARVAEWVVEQNGKAIY